jgi:multidrug resistance efflux pump
MSYTTQQLEALRKALATGERRVSFGDRTVEYRSIDELKAAIREVEAELARTAGEPRTRQIRVTTGKGF